MTYLAQVRKRASPHRNDFRPPVNYRDVSAVRHSTPSDGQYSWIFLGGPWMLLSVSSNGIFDGPAKGESHEGSATMRTASKPSGAGLPSGSSSMRTRNNALHVHEKRGHVLDIRGRLIYCLGCLGNFDNFEVQTKRRKGFEA